MNRIKKLRQEFGYTQQDLADKIHGAKSTIAMYENETRKPSMEILIKLSNLLNCSIDYLLCKTDIRNPGEQIDDVLNETMIGMSKAEYEKLTENQKKQIRDFAIFVKNQIEQNG